MFSRQAMAQADAKQIKAKAELKAADKIRKADERKALKFGWDVVPLVLLAGASVFLAQNPDGEGANRRTPGSRSGGTSRRGRRPRHANTARSGSRRCPVTTSPSASSRQNTVRSGRPKPASGVASVTVEVFWMGLV